MYGRIIESDLINAGAIFSQSIHVKWSNDTRFDAATMIRKQ